MIIIHYVSPYVIYFIQSYAERLYYTLIGILVCNLDWETVFIFYPCSTSFITSVHLATNLTTSYSFQTVSVTKICIKELKNNAVLLKIYQTSKPLALSYFLVSFVNSCVFSFIEIASSAKHRNDYLRHNRSI